MAWILNPSENHGLGDYFLKFFLMECIKNNIELIRDQEENIGSVINLDFLNLKDVIVRTEESFNTKKADITIRIENKFLCVIENKIKSGESEDQTINYVKLSKKKYPNYKYLYIFLTPSGYDADSEEFVPIDYNIIKNLLIQTLDAKKEVLNMELIFLIKQFIQNIEVNILDESKISEMCRKLYNRHKIAIEKIYSNRPDYIGNITNEIKKLLLDDDWLYHPTKTICQIFKKKWFEDFKEFFYPQCPFFHYEVLSWIKNDELFISVDFHIEEDRNLGRKYELRDKFTEILDEQIDLFRPKIFEYNKKRSSAKFRKIIVSGGYNNETDPKNIAQHMKMLIDDTIKPLEKCINLFKEKYKENLSVWKKELSVNK